MNEIVTLAEHGAIAGGGFAIGVSAKKFLETITVKGTDALTEYVGARFLAWRGTNIEKLLDRADKLIKESGVAARPVPNATLLPIMEAAANVDDPTLSEMFALLLASAASSQPDANHPSFPKMIGEMSAKDAIMLTVISRFKDKQANDRTVTPLDGRIVNGGEKISSEAVLSHAIDATSQHVALDNLQRLKLVEVDRNVIRTGAGNPLTVTPLGRVFISVCVQPLGTQ